MELTKLKQIIEAALMASGEVLSVERLQLLFEEYEKPKSPMIKEALDSLMEDFTGRGIELVEVASGYRLQVRKDVAPWVTRLWDEKPQRYSRALLETMSLIAYRQPITRGDIEDVRGVAVSSNIIRTLLDREWVRVVGHRDVPGRPAMYATTKEFLDYFSLKSLDELPSLDEIREIDDANENLDLINAEKQASVTREYDFENKDDVEARGEEVLAETELELEEAQKLIDQVEDNVFNKPSEEELAAEREAERQAKAAEEQLAEEAATERQLADKYAQPSFSDMANRTQQRLSSNSNEADGPTVIDLADKIADHQARLAGSNEEASLNNSSTEQPEEELTLLQQQERLMQQLMQQESERQSKQGREATVEHQAEPSIEDNIDAEKELLAEEAAIERELLEQEALEREQQEKEALEQAALEEMSFEEELLEKERLAEEALESELSLEDSSLEEEPLESASLAQGSSTKKNSLFDD